MDLSGPSIDVKLKERKKDGGGWGKGIPKIRGLGKG